MDDLRAPLSTTTINRRVQPFEVSGERRPNADITLRVDSSPISSNIVQNRCSMFLRMQFSLAVELPPSKPMSLQLTAPDPPLLFDPYVSHVGFRLSTGKQLSNPPFAGQSPVDDVSPMGAVNHNEILGQRGWLLSGLGQNQMGQVIRVNYPNLITSPLVLEGFLLDRIYKIRHLRLFHMDIIHGARVAILCRISISYHQRRFDMTDLQPRTLVLGYRVILIQLTHDVEQNSPLNLSIVRFIAILVVIVLPLSMIPDVIASSMSV